MKFVLYTNSVSAHQLPFARELVKRIGEENFRYVYTGENLQRGNQEVAASEGWILRCGVETEDILRTCDILLVGGLYPVELMERRLAEGKKTLYMSERWFKPVKVWSFWLPGWVKMFVPSYFRRARRFAKMLQSPNYWYLPIGPWAAKDMRLVQRLTFCGTAANPFIPWAYFVAPSSHPTIQPFNHSTSPLRILWVGRMLDWKRVDTIIRAVALANRKGGRRFLLTLVGEGPEKLALERLVARLGVAEDVTFCPRVPIEEVRTLMRQHDVYVLPSNAYEGWGAVVPEALSEGLPVIGTYEAGASAAILDQSCLFPAGDARELARMLVAFDGKWMVTRIPPDYTPAGAAERLLALCCGSLCYNTDKL